MYTLETMPSYYLDSDEVDNILLARTTRDLSNYESRSKMIVDLVLLEYMRTKDEDFNKF